MGQSNQQADYLLDGKPYMLMRLPNGGRSWQRTGTPDVPYHRRFAADIGFGNLPAEFDDTVAWDDWSGGAFEAYHEQGGNRYHWSENFDARFPRQLVHCQRPALLAGSVAGIPNAGSDVEYMKDVLQSVNGQPVGGGRVFFYGRNYDAYIVKADPGGFGVTVGLRGNTLVNRPALYGSTLYVGAAQATAYWTFDAAGDSPAQNPAGMPGRVFTAAGNRLWRAHGAAGRNILLQSAAGDASVTANWSATLTLGNSLSDIQDLLAINDQVYVGMADGVYCGDQSGTFFNVMPTFTDFVHQDNARDLTIHNGELIIPSAVGLFGYTPSVFGGARGTSREIGPYTKANRSPARGYIRAVQSFGPYLYAGLWTGSQSWLLAGVEQPTGWAWHTLHRLPHTSKIHRIHFDAVTVTGLGVEAATCAWVATEASFGANTGATAPLYFWPIPRLNDNPLNGAGTFTVNYMGSARMDLGAVHFGAVGTPKDLRSVEVWTEGSSLTGTANGQWAEVWYSLDNGPFVYLDTAATSPKSALFFPALAGSFVTCQSVELSLRSYTTNSSLSPVYRALVLRGTLRPRSVDQITAVTRIADGVRDRQGGVLPDGATQLQALRDLSHVGQPVQLVDLAGAAQWVVVVPPISESEVYQQGMDYPEVAATVTMAVLEFTGS